MSKVAFDTLKALVTTILGVINSLEGDRYGVL